MDNRTIRAHTAVFEHRIDIVGGRHVVVGRQRGLDLAKLTGPRMFEAQAPGMQALPPEE